MSSDLFFLVLHNIWYTFRQSVSAATARNSALSSVGGKLLMSCVRIHILLQLQFEFYFLFCNHDSLKIHRVLRVF